MCSSNTVWLLNLTQMVWSKQPTSEPKPLPRYSHSQVCTSSLCRPHTFVLHAWFHTLVHQMHCNLTTWRIDIVHKKQLQRCPVAVASRQFSLERCAEQILCSYDFGLIHSMPRLCQLGIRKNIRPVKNWWGAGMVTCLARGTNDLHMVQLMPLPPHLLLFC